MMDFPSSIVKPCRLRGRLSADHTRCQQWMAYPAVWIRLVAGKIPPLGLFDLRRFHDTEDVVERGDDRLKSCNRLLATDTLRRCADRRQRGSQVVVGPNNR